ncbi:MAG: hypothetical protein Q7S13_06250 [Candidatus Omnitrophota bacterium]|nr:hypothetical protein [Candidatus Omnitrophota bacterium]
MPDYGEYGLTIAEDFKKYLKTGDPQVIEQYSARELRAAISHLSPYYDNNKQWYRFIQDRIDELQKQEHVRQIRSNRSWVLFKEKWLDRFVAGGAGLIVGLLF